MRFMRLRVQACLSSLCNRTSFLQSSLASVVDNSEFIPGEVGVEREAL